MVPTLTRSTSERPGSRLLRHNCMVPTLTCSTSERPGSRLLRHNCMVPTLTCSTSERLGSRLLHHNCMVPTLTCSTSERPGSSSLSLACRRGLGWGLPVTYGRYPDSKYDRAMPDGPLPEIWKITVWFTLNKKHIFNVNFAHQRTKCHYGCQIQQNFAKCILNNINQHKAE